MKRNLVLSALLTLVVLALGTRAWANCGHCEGDKEAKGGHHGKGHNACPSSVEGAQIAVENTADGVLVKFTAKDPAAVKKLQETAAEHFKGKGMCPNCKEGKQCADCKAGKKGHDKKERWVCPMNCETSSKPGKCSKCGMDLKKADEKK